MEQVQQGAQAMRLDIQPFIVSGSDELTGAFAAMARERADAVIVMATLSAHQTLVDLVMKYRLPTLSTERSVTHAEALISYSASVAERGREIAGYIDKILKGAKPAELPVQQPTKFELVINLKAAKALGLVISPTMLARAEEVIE
jgi:putative ABC transport system substrate-binding protein